MRFLLVFGLVFLLCACGSSESKDFHAFGTKVTVEIDEVPKKRAQLLFASIEVRLQEMHRRWHAWQDSELSQIRKACQNKITVPVSRDLTYLIEEGKKLEIQSQGYFNPAIGELIDAWGFLSQASTQKRPAPTPQKIHELLSYQPSLQDIDIKDGQLTCTNPHLRLDLGAYAKGYGMSKIMDYLREQGVKRALINAGGDVMILQGPHDPPRKIGVRDPDSDKPLEVFTLSESTSVFTSGNYVRKFKDSQSSRVYHHLINPKTGYPSTYFTSVTVIDPDPVKADAAATALLASDQDSWPAVVKGLGLKKYLLINKDGEKIHSPSD